MDVSTRKMALIQWLIDLQDMKMINQLEQLSSQSAPTNQSISREEMDGLEHALQQVEKGEVISGEEVHAHLKAKYSL